MTDLEMTKLCAEAMGLMSLPEYAVMPNGHIFNRATSTHYWPLTDDEQAMALVKRFHPHVCWITGDYWEVQNSDMNAACAIAHNPDLNRAVVECVAQMRATDPDTRTGPQEKANAE